MAAPSLRDRCKALRPSDFPFLIPVPGRFADIDAHGHVNNIAVARLLSEARSHMLRSTLAALDPADRSHFLVGQQAIFYAGETLYPGTIEIGCGLFELGRSTIRVGQALFNEGRCTAIAEAVLVAAAGGHAVTLTGPARDAFSSIRLAGADIPRQLAPLD